MEDSTALGNGYSQYTQMFGDGWFWTPCFFLIADYEQRRTPTVRKQVVIPSEHVFIAELTKQMCLSLRSSRNSLSACFCRGAD